MARVFFGGIKSVSLRLSIIVVAIVMALPVNPALALGAWSSLQSTASWNVAELSGNGQYALTAPDSGRLYLTKNNNTVAEVMPAGNVNVAWGAAAINGSGSVMFAAGGSTLYRSRAYGQAWMGVSSRITGTHYFEQLDISDDGRKVIAGDPGGRLFVSNDFGDSWAEARPIGDANGSWRAVAVSADGNTYLAAEGNNGGVFKSTDGGVTWTAAGPPHAAGAADWRVAEVGTDGQVMVVAERGGRVWRTVNGGTNWTETQPSGDNSRSWAAGDMSKDGQKMIISYDSGRLYTTDNGGSTWTETQPAGNIGTFWYSMAISDEGTEALAGRSGGDMYVNGVVGDGSFPTTEDADGVSASVENAAPNGGDGNNDGTPDSQQEHVVSFVNPLTQKYVTLEVQASCMFRDTAIKSESANTVADPGYEYDTGFMHFTASCFAFGVTANIKQFYHGVTDGNYSIRKYNPNTNAYFTIAEATKTQVTIAGQPVLKVEYAVVDGSSLDIDGTANAIVVDPVGLASNNVGVPVTGLGGTRNHR